MRTITIMCGAVLCLLHGAVALAAQSDLSGDYSAAYLEQVIQEPAEWVSYPRPGQADEWQRLLPQGKVDALIKNAEQYLDWDWPLAKASVFLDYVRNGNRTRFESIHFARRLALVALVMGELVEGEGRFMDDIANGLWAISEETFWGIQGGLKLQKRGAGLADVNDPVVDLFAAQTAQILAWTSYLLADGLDAVHPMIRERIYTETDRRIFKVIESKPSYRWTGAPQPIEPGMSYQRKSFLQRRPNNWNPWISSNLLTSILLLEQDRTRRAEFVHQVLGYLDKYLDPHPADGGSDEGTGYWGHAAGSTFECFDLVQMATGGVFDEFSQPLIINMGEFIAKAYIGDGYYVNFADAAPRRNHSPMLIYRFGKAVGSEAMMSMAAHFAAQTDFRNSIPDGRSLHRNLRELFYTQELLRVEAAEPLLADSWLPDIQVMFSRDSEGSTQGLYLAAKAGHNEESHNHNDVGSFLVYKDGQPAIIDIGSATYTANYGNEWVRKSEYHNLSPVIDGKGQLKGRKYGARNVEYLRANRETVLFQDFAPAYAEDAGIRRWDRTHRHLKGRSILISDRFEFDTVPGKVELPMIFNSPPDLSKPGKVMVRLAEGTSLAVTYDEGLFDCTIDEITPEDRKVTSRWGNTLYRVLFTLRQPSLSGRYSFVIE